jgi:AcrR family transcriptional regulator
VKVARPVGANAEETRSKILKSASILFADHGFEGTSVRQIARGADVSLGMIRHYFGSKEGLYRACIASAYRIYGELGNQIRGGISAGGKPQDVMSEATRAGFRFAIDNRAACKLVLWNLMERDTWRHEPGHREMVPFIRAAAQGLAPVLGRSVADTALMVRSLIFLVARYATADMDEVASLLDENDAAKAGEGTLAAIEHHLVETARCLFAASTGS